MSLLDTAPFWALAVLVFTLRATDVTLGTVRTISVVHGHTTAAVFLGFFEIMIWVTAVSQVIIKIQEYPLLTVAYAGGFAVGNALGIALERRLAMGLSLVTFVSGGTGGKIAETLRGIGQRVTTVAGDGRDGPREIIYATARRRDTRKLVDAARSLDPDLFYMVQLCSETSSAMGVPSLRGRWKSK